MSISDPPACLSLAARRCALGDRARIDTWLSLIAIVLLAGCRTGQYRAAKLPSWLDVAPAAKSDGINLAQLAGQGTGTSQIGPGDLVTLNIASGMSSEQVDPVTSRVAQDGTVLVPLVGPVQVNGLEPFAAEQRIAFAAVERGVLRQPYVTLQVVERAVNRVTVLGAVAKPGIVELPRGASDLANALAAAGGLAEDAGTAIDVLRHNPETFVAAHPRHADDGASTVQLAAHITGPGTPGSFAPPPMRSESQFFEASRTRRIDLANMSETIATGYELTDRDVVMVHAEEKRVIHVTGLVVKPDRFEVSPKRDVRVLDAIAMAGGIKSPMADKVFVIRQLPEMTEPAVIKVSIAKAKRNGEENLRLTSGDLVSVEMTPTTMFFDTASTLFRTTIGIGGNFAAF